MYPIILILVLLLSPFSGQIQIETTESDIPLEYNCDSVHFTSEKFVTCACINGVWAFQIRQPGRANEWKIIGGKTNCIYIGQWILRMRQISKSLESSNITWMDHETVLVTNSESWEVNVGGRKLCLHGPTHGSYCKFEVHRKIISSVQNRCTENGTKLEPFHCETFGAKKSMAHRIHCQLIPKNSENLAYNRLKREEGDSSPPRNKTAEMDEEYIDPLERSKYLGDPATMDAITDIMLKKISDILELGKDRRKKRSVVPDTPAAYLLKLCATIMEASCTAISKELFEIAIEAFLELQRNIFILREPYIAYAPYERILRSLEKCHNNSIPFKFFQNDTVIDNSSIMCESQVPAITTTWLFDLSLSPDEVGYIRQTREVPDYAASDPNMHEPVSEIVWKMFVNTLSSCYPYFKNYYNDHHTFAVTLMPFFTNQIQEIWYINGTNFTSARNSSGWLNYTTDVKWYGYLFGNVSRLYWDLDHCYSATRTQTVAYPYFMNRPPRDFTNEWTRRKRSEPGEIVRVPCIDDSDTINLSRDHHTVTYGKAKEAQRQAVSGEKT